MMDEIEEKHSTISGESQRGGGDCRSGGVVVWSRELVVPFIVEVGWFLPKEIKGGGKDLPLELICDGTSEC